MTRNESIFRAFSIVEYLARCDDWVGLRTLARDLDLDPATAHRFLTSLKDLGYVQQHSEDSRYRLTLKFAWLGSRALEQLQLPNIARPLMEHLTTVANETTHLAILDKDQIMYVGKIDNRQAMQMRSRVGSRGCLHSTSVGKACLAFLPEDEREAMLALLPLPALTKNTITSLDELRHELELTQKRGYAVDDEENEIGIRCVGAPVFDHSGHIAGALSISGWTITMTPERVPDLAADLLKTCCAISKELGYFPSYQEAHGDR
jgi:DNA-binding IclR family transcriptional regulator